MWGGGALAGGLRGGDQEEEWRNLSAGAAAACAWGLGRGLVGPVSNPLVWPKSGSRQSGGLSVLPLGGGPRLNSTGRLIVDATRAAPFTDTLASKQYSPCGVWMVLFPAASSMSDPNSVAVVLHIDFGYPPLLSRSSLDGPLRPYRTEISTCCIRVQPRPRFLLCFQQ